MRAGIQNDSNYLSLPGFPFDASTSLSIDPELCRRVDFAQGGEPVEPRVSPKIVLLARNDSFLELRHSLLQEEASIKYYC
jgi:hypothetical protein